MRNIEFSARDKHGMKIKLGDTTVTMMGNVYSVSKSPTMFDLLNEYFKFLATDKPDRLENLATVYESIGAELLSVTPGSPPEEMLRNWAYAIMDNMEYEHMLGWLQRTEHFVLPLGIQLEFNSNIITDALGSREQTYIKDDYIRLAALALISKAMLPAYSMFISTSTTIPHTKIRDYVIFKEINGHRLFQTDAMDKLRAYISKTMEKYVGNRASSNTTSKLEIQVNIAMHGLSLEDLDDVMLAGIFVSKLPTSNITENGSKSNLVTNIHSFIKNTLTFESFTKQKLADKKVADTQKDAEDKTSSLEKYNTVTSKLMLGSIVELNWFYRDLRNVIDKYYPDYKLRITRIEATKNRLLAYPDLEINTAQSTLLAWALTGTIDPRAIPYLEKDTMCGLLGLAAEYLWQIDLKELSLVVSSVGERSQDSLKTLYSTSRIPREIQNELLLHYPYKQRVMNNRRKQRLLDNLAAGYTDPLPEDTATNTPVFNVIKDLTKGIYDTVWNVTCSSEELLEVTSEISKTLTLSRDIKTQLAKLLIHNSKRVIKNKEETTDVSTAS